MTKDKPLTNEEICEMRTMYRQALDKAEQVKILQDLYLVSEKTVVRVLGLKKSPVLHGHAKADPSRLAAALRDVRENGISVYVAEKKYGITSVTLKKYLKMEAMR